MATNAFDEARHNRRACRPDRYRAELGAASKNGSSKLGLELRPVHERSWVVRENHGDDVDKRRR